MGKKKFYGKNQQRAKCTSEPSHLTSFWLTEWSANKSPFKTAFSTVKQFLKAPSADHIRNYSEGACYTLLLIQLYP